MVIAVIAEKQPLTLFVRSRTVAKVDSILFSKEYKKAQRDELIHIAHVKHGYRLKEIADHLGIHYTTVTKVLKNEDKN